MIFVVKSTGPRSCFEPLLGDAAAPRIELLQYDDVLEASHLRRGTYVFTDFDRLRTEQLVEAARVFRRLQENGCRVVNDPARVLKRAPLLRALHRADINPFSAYSADGAHPERFPVFIRIADDHKGARSDLIHDQASLDAAIEAAVAAGLPRCAILVTEYAAEPIQPGVFRKSSLYRVADRFVPDIWWYGRSWDIKGDRDNLVGEAFYSEELKMFHENSYPKELEKAFAIANIEFGRLDYALIQDRVCIYEINTYPTFFGPRIHPVPARVESIRLRWERLLEAFHAIDTDASESEELMDVAGLSIAAMKEAHLISPTLRSYHLQLSQEYARRGDLTAAVTAAEAALSASPDSRKALSNLSLLLAKQGRLEEAIDVSNQLLRLHRRRASEWSRLAWLLCRLGRYEETRDRMIEGLGACGDHWEIYLRLSQAQRGMGETWLRWKPPSARWHLRPATLGLRTGSESLQNQDPQLPRSRALSAGFGYSFPADLAPFARVWQCPPETRMLKYLPRHKTGLLCRTMDKMSTANRHRPSFFAAPMTPKRTVTAKAV